MAEGEGWLLLMLELGALGLGNFSKEVTFELTVRRSQPREEHFWQREQQLQRPVHLRPSV